MTLKLPWGVKKPRDGSQVFHKAKALNVAFTLARSSQHSGNTLASASGPLSAKAVVLFSFIPFEMGCN